MGADWREVPLGEVVTLQRGFDLPTWDRKPGGVPVVSSSGLSGTHSEARVLAPGVVTGRYGTIGEVFYLCEEFWPLNTTLYVKDFKGNDPRYVSYLLRTVDFFAHSDKSSVPGVNRNDLHRSVVRVPALPVQRAIAHILGALDDKIELGRRMNETLEAMARAIFKSWFVDFDPVRAKAAGCHPPRMDAETAALFPAVFEESTLGNIPQGWSVGSFSDNVEIRSGGTPKTAVQEYWGGTLPWFSVVDAPRPSDVYVIDTEKKITAAGCQNSAAEVLPRHTTIITARGTVGKCALVGTPMAMNQSCYGLVSRGEVGPFYLYFATRHLVAELQQRAHGSVFDTITRDTFKTVSLVVPTRGVAARFEEQVEPLLHHIEANLRASAILAALRDTLLPKLLSGEIRVGKMEKVVGKAV
jgi:type I restriction enzyme S subunit